MKKAGSMLASAFLLSSICFSGQIVVEVNGVVETNLHQNGPFANAQIGDPVHLSFEVTTPGRDESGGTTALHRVIVSSLVLDVGGATAGLIGPVAYFRTANDSLWSPPHYWDGLILYPTELDVPGSAVYDVDWWAVDYTTTAFSSHLLEEIVGHYSASLFSTQIFNIRENYGTGLWVTQVEIIIRERELGTAYCSGDGSVTICPCGNHGPSGAGCASSTGEGATLSASGSNSTFVDQLVLHGSSLVPGEAALLFTGTLPVNGGAGETFGDGLRCAGGAVTRLGAQLATPTGDATWGPGLGAANGWGPGETLFLQVWYRDPVGGPCGAGFNLTNGLELGLY